MKIDSLFEQDFRFETKPSQFNKLKIGAGKSASLKMIQSAMRDTANKRVTRIKNEKIVAAASFSHESDKSTIIHFIGSISAGSGSELMKFIFDAAKKAGSHKIFVWSKEDADDFYIKHGFKNSNDGEGHMVKEI